MRNYLVLLCLVLLNSGCGIIIGSNPSYNYFKTQKINHVKGNLYRGDTIALLKPYVNTYLQTEEKAFEYQEKNSIDATIFLQQDIRKRLMKHLVCKIVQIPNEYDSLVKEVYQMFDSLRRAKVKRYVFSDTSIVAKLNRIRKDYKINSDFIVLSCLWWSNMWGRYYDDQVYLTMSPIPTTLRPEKSTIMEQHIIIISLSKQEVVFYRRLYRDFNNRFFPSGYDLTRIGDNNSIAFFYINKSLKKRKKR